MLIDEYKVSNWANHLLVESSRGERQGVREALHTHTFSYHWVKRPVRLEVEQLMWVKEDACMKCIVIREGKG